MKKMISAMLLVLQVVMVSEARAFSEADMLKSFIDEQGKATKKQIAQMKRQVQILEQQNAQLQDQLSAMTGAYGRGKYEWNRTEKAARVLPGTWKDVVNRQQKGEFAERRKSIEKKLEILPASAFSSNDKQRAQDYQMNTDSVTAAMVSGEVLYDEVNTHLQSVIDIGKKIDNTENVKDAQDMQNRLTVEMAMLQAAMTRASAMNIRLQAGMMHMNNRDEAANEMFYQWK